MRVSRAAHCSNLAMRVMLVAWKRVQQSKILTEMKAVVKMGKVQTTTKKMTRRSLRELFKAIKMKLGTQTIKIRCWGSGLQILSNICRKSRSHQRFN
jgi:hypothetical protein